MTNQTVKSHSSHLPAENAKTVLASGGLIGGLAALAGSSCCILPIALVQFGLGGAWIANLAFFVNAKSYLLAASVISIVLAFVAAFWRNRSPSKGTLVVLCIATILTGAAYIVPLYEGRILRALSG